MYRNNFPKTFKHSIISIDKLDAYKERERTLFATTLQKQTTIQMVNMWQAARKGLKPIELATKKGKKLKTQT